MSSTAHPLRSRPELSLEQQVELYRELSAQLWDEVWWHHLPWYRRLFYWLQGFRSPIQRFYND